MSTPMPPSPTTPSPTKRPRRRIALIGAAGLVAVLVFVLVYFQPQKLFIDDKVEEAAPEGAVPLVIAEEPAVEEPMTDDSTADQAMDDDSMTDDSMADQAMDDDSMTDDSMTDEPAAVPSPATFVSLDHGTSGNVLFLQDPTTGERFLRFEGLDTDNGPDLKVYLSTNPVDGPEGAFDDDFVDLGKLQGNQGDQNYLLPADVDLSRFASVVIWCDRFDSAFGAADLST